MRRPAKESAPKLSNDAQRLIGLAQAIVQAASRIEERASEQNLDSQLQKLFKSNHQDSIDSALNALFNTNLDAYDALMESVEAVSESGHIEIEENGGSVKYDTLLVAAPVLAWTRFSISSGAIAADILQTINSHFSAHLLADGVRVVFAPMLYAIDQLPKSHAEVYQFQQKLTQNLIKNSNTRNTGKAPETAPFLADTRYLLALIAAPSGSPLFRWQMPQTQFNAETERGTALEQWQQQAAPTLARLLPGCGIELLLPEAYYVACREADRLIRPVSVRAAVYYLTQTLSLEAAALRAVVAPFGDEGAENEIDEYRIAFTMQQNNDVIYGIVWPLYGAEEEDGATGNPDAAAHKKPLEEITELLRSAGIRHINTHNERFAAEYCDDCGAPLFADPTGDLVHAEMPEDAPQTSEHFH